MRRFDQRQGFLVSAAIHLTLLMILIAHPPVARRTPDEIDPATLEKKDLVFLPPGLGHPPARPEAHPGGARAPGSAPHGAAADPAAAGQTEGPDQRGRAERPCGPRGRMILRRDTT